MQHLRIGSIVSAGITQPNGSGGTNSIFQTGTVTNVTSSYLEVEDANSAGVVMPWASIFRVTVTTD